MTEISKESILWDRRISNKPNWFLEALCQRGILIIDESYNGKYFEIGDCLIENPIGYIYCRVGDFIVMDHNGIYPVSAKNVEF